MLTTPPVPKALSRSVQFTAQPVSSSQVSIGDNLQLKSIRISAALVAIAIAPLVAMRARAQALPTASANVRISAFAGVAGNLTGLETAKNGDITAGIDIGIRPFFGFYPALEGRGMYPVERGQLVSADNLLGGLRLARHKNRFTPYADVLFGRGLLKYANGGLPDSSGTLYYLQNTSNVISLGVGTDWDWSEHLSLKADLQLQRYDSPVVTTGTLFSKVLTIGVVYRLGFNRIK